MELFWKGAAAVLLAVILGLALGRQEKDIAALLTIAVCCMVAALAVAYLEPVLDLLWELEAVGALQEGLLSILLKAVGIALTAEIAGTVCADAGNASLGKVLHLLSAAAILYLSIPIFQALLALIQEILGTL